jgi:DNA-binding helix-hairpin-helix protein with protein kinase domain
MNIFIPHNNNKKGKRNNTYLCSTILTVLLAKLLARIPADFSRPSYTVLNPSKAPAATSRTPSILLEASCSVKLHVEDSNLAPCLWMCGARYRPRAIVQPPIFEAENNNLCLRHKTYLKPIIHQIRVVKLRVKVKVKIIN